MSNRRLQSFVSVAVAVCALLSAGCTPPAEHHDDATAATVTITDQWANAAETGMAAVFGTFTNSGHHEARIVSGNSPLSGRVEIHEVAPDASGTKTMRPKANGITVPAGGTHELVPGGDHLMLMDLKQPLQPGADVTLTVMFEDGSILPVSAQIRDFPGADEEYAPDHNHG